MKYFILSVLLLANMGILAQTDDEKAVRKVIEQLFDGMRKGDTTMIRPLFHETCRMQTAFVNRKSNKPELQTEASINGFLKSVGTPHTAMYDERILSYDIKIDGVMASAWTPYEFWLGDKFLHCGIDHFLLFKGDKGWKIIHLADTRRWTDCGK
jgi:hypothetical protein